MPPAVECGECGAKWKTANEPATEVEMRKLFAEIFDHGILAAKQVVERYVFNGKKSTIKHTINTEKNLRYYEVTPIKGFENAKIICE